MIDGYRFVFNFPPPPVARAPGMGALRCDFLSCDRNKPGAIHYVPAAAATFGWLEIAGAAAAGFLLGSIVMALVS